MEALQDKANKLAQTGNPATARQMRNNIDNLNRRYDALVTTSGQYNEDLHGMLDTLGKLCEDVDNLEDWVFPTLDVLESRELKKQEIPDIEKVTKVRHCGFTSQRQDISWRCIDCKILWFVLAWIWMVNIDSHLAKKATHVHV